VETRPATAHRQVTDADGQLVTFATPSEPTVEERHRYALAVQQAREPAPLSPAQQAEVDPLHQRRRELFPHPDCD
jgi:hypothetical protein